MNKNPNFLNGLREEIKRVSFPTRQTTINLTVTVFIISLIVSLYLGIIDVFLAKGLEIVTATK